MTKTDEIMEQIDIYTELICDSILSGEGHLVSHAEAKLRLILEDALNAPDGWKLVPVEPTDEMLDAACISQAGYINTTFKEWADNHSNGIVERIRKYLSGDYKAMISAAPECEAKP
jgi:hypothetical protein